MPLFYTPSSKTAMFSIRRTSSTNDYSYARAVKSLMSNVLTPGACPKRAAFSGSLLLAITVMIGVIVAGGPDDVFGQWRRKTPRDTVKVAANSDAWKPSKLTLTAGFQIHAKYLGTFGMDSGQSGAGFEAK